MAVGQFYRMNLFLAFYLCFALSLSAGEPLKSVNLGGWLVTEGWIRPSLFSTIKEGDLLDGTQFWLYSRKLHKYLSAENGGGNILVANRRNASDWETFRLWRINESTFNFRVFNKKFVGLENQGEGSNMVAVSNAPNNTEMFQIIRNNAGKGKNRNLIKIKASNGLFVQAQSETLVTADYEDSAGWEDDNPSVFKMKILSTATLRGEYQLTNGLGPERAPQVMQDHWNSFITEEDFKFMSKNGLNAVRIPVGWWIAYDPIPPKPFVGGSLAALDNAFKWAQNNGMQVIIDLHAIQGSQNDKDHSGTRDGFIEWDDSYLPETVAVIDFLAARYAKNPSLAAIQLMNEPWSPYINPETLKKYYKEGYDAVRKYTRNAYVIMSVRMNTRNTTEFLSFAGSKGFDRVVIGVHYYYIFYDMFKNMTVQQTIDYIHNHSAEDLASVTPSNGTLSYVGEWTGELHPALAKNATKQDYQRFVQAQIDVYGKATFGWAFWTYKTPKHHWSLKWMIKNNIIKLKA